MRSSRWLALILILAVVVLVLIDAAKVTAKPPLLTTRIAEAQVALWKCQDQLGVERSRKGTDPWSLPKSTKIRTKVLRKWSIRWNNCLENLQERQRQWDWQAWLPDKWMRVARCETGINWNHANSSYVSAFGISVQSYDDDADYMGVRHWYVRGQGNPSPWEQYQAALGHYKQHGGFSGWGCRGA